MGVSGWSVNDSCRVIGNGCQSRKAVAASMGAFYKKGQSNAEAVASLSRDPNGANKIARLARDKCDDNSGGEKQVMILTGVSVRSTELSPLED